VDTNAWGIKLSDSLVRNLNWQNVRGLGVVHLIGRVTEVEDRREKSRNGKKVKLSKSLEAEPKEGGSQVEQKSSLVLDVLPPALAAPTRSVAQPIHVRDIRLGDLRRVLLDDGLGVEFRGEGTLLIDRVVVVRKGGVGSEGDH